MTAAIVILTAGTVPAVAEYVAQLLDEWQSTRARRLTVLRRYGRCA